MSRRSCPAARLLAAELAADIALARYTRTRSHRAKAALDAARLECLCVWRVTA